MSRFRAMPRLLDESELVELARLPGFDVRIVRKLRQQRRRIFRLYLAELSAEFHTFAREVVERAANDPTIDPSFVDKVTKSRIRIGSAIWYLRISLLLSLDRFPKVHQKTVDLVDSLRPFAAAMQSI